MGWQRGQGKAKEEQRKEHSRAEGTVELPFIQHASSCQDTTQDKTPNRPEGLATESRTPVSGGTGRKWGTDRKWGDRQ